MQHHIEQCKKYNEAKIHRKYEIIIDDLNKENNQLKDKLAMELKARPASQTYVSDLIDKMITLRNNNHALEQSNTQLTLAINRLETKYEPMVASTSKNLQSQPEE